ncbi:uncharacterized protein LOC129813212 isoform X2 [Salvelinus fontinalis]|uniref:uncharacterized protein LOC129813212 isoform X2 n=1 Tax=Salvelinus fontinalis TaxID=8038 RepID=UPI0024859EA8|nr:uncharacterized protein LOC129813212 isoform X2 [Salvelinus fontinalis]XP_055721463.1 uncharacterized protein LOC129813212 isoform X2 [Salvelinus fontinalis]
MVIKSSLPLSFTAPKSEGPDCKSGAQSEQQAPEMASVKQEDCSQTLGLNVNIKDEVKEEEIETFVFHGPAGELKEKTEEHKVSLLKDKGKRKPKGMEKETEKKRHRFTPGDEDLIISGVLGHWEDLFGAQAHIRPRGSKTATWNTIAGTLTSAVARCGDDVRKEVQSHKEPSQAKGFFYPDIVHPDWWGGQHRACADRPGAATFLPNGRDRSWCRAC